MARALGNSGVAVCSAPAPGPAELHRRRGLPAERRRRPPPQMTGGPPACARRPAGRPAQRAATLRADAGMVRVPDRPGARDRPLAGHGRRADAVARDGRAGRRGDAADHGRGPGVGPAAEANGDMHGAHVGEHAAGRAWSRTPTSRPRCCGSSASRSRRTWTGNPIGRPSAGGAVRALPRRQLEYRRIRFPVQMVELAFVCSPGLRRDRRAPVGWTRSGPDHAAGRPPAGSPAGVPRVGVPDGDPRPAGCSRASRTHGRDPVPDAGAGRRWRRWRRGSLARARTRRFGFLGAVGLAFIALDLLTGDPRLRMPLEGGVMFDGVRFYGLPNFADLAAAGERAVRRGRAAHTVGDRRAGRRPVWWPGWPSLGADVGGSITLFVAAGLWFAVRAGRWKAPAVGPGDRGRRSRPSASRVVLLGEPVRGRHAHACHAVRRTDRRAGSRSVLPRSATGSASAAA